MKNKILVLTIILLIGLTGYPAQVAKCGQKIKASPDGKMAVKDIAAYDYKETSRETLNGKEYIKINLSELTDLCVNNDEKKLSKNYVLRGSVVREEKLDSAGRFGLVRLGIFCCVVHAIPIGLAVKYDRYAELNNGEWVKVYGRIKRVSNISIKDDDNDPSAAVKKAFVIIPDKVVKINVASDPYIYLFNCKLDEPYYY